MTNEARKAGLTFDPRKQAEFQCSNIIYELDYLNDSSHVSSRVSGNREDYSSLLRLSSEKGPLHDELKFGMGWSYSHVCKRKAKNSALSLIPGHGKFLGKGNYRYIPPGALIHHSALHRMKVDPAYRPPNLRISDTSNVMNKDDPVAEYIIQGADK